MCVHMCLCLSWPEGSSSGAIHLGFFCFVLNLEKRFIFKCVCVYLSAGTHGGEKRVLDPLELELQVVQDTQCVFWELNLGSHKSVLLSTEPSL